MKRLLLFVALCLTLLVVAGFAVPTEGYRGPVSDHFDGERFSNQVDVRHGGLFTYLAMRVRTEYEPWPRRVEVRPAEPPVRRLPDGMVRATFVNHATVLLQLGRVNVLTDPIWSTFASPVGWAGPRRVHAPGVRWEDLPPIDVVVVSHNHYDHLDLETLRRLSSEHHPRILVGLGLEGWLRRRGVEGAEELDWWEGATVGGGAVRVTLTPTQHWSNRTPRDRRRTLWGGFVLEHAGRTVYFAGDTAVGPHFRQVFERFGAPDLALLPIGAYAPRDFMKTAHLSPREAVAAHGELRARRSMAIHFGTFQLSQEAREAPGRRLAAARAEAGLPPEAFVVPEVGATLTLAPGEPRETQRATPQAVVREEG